MGSAYGQGRFRLWVGLTTEVLDKACQWLVDEDAIFADFIIFIKFVNMRSLGRKTHAPDTLAGLLQPS